MATFAAKVRDLADFLVQGPGLYENLRLVKFFNSITLISYLIFLVYGIFTEDFLLILYSFYMFIHCPRDFLFAGIFGCLAILCI